jgi:hypothetical protein
MSKVRHEDGVSVHYTSRGIWPIRVHSGRKLLLKYKLVGIPYIDLVAWPFADYVFSTHWDVMSDVTKSRLYGFHDVVDSEAMFVRLLRRFREERIVP